MLSQNLLSPALDARFCNLLLGWDDLEQRLNGPALLDQNMIGWNTRNTYTNREEVRGDLEQLRVEYPHNDSYGRQIDRLIFYVGDIIAPHDASMPQRIENMLGVKFIPFSDDVISKARARVIQHAALLGLEFDSRLKEYTRQADPIMSDAHLLSNVDATYRNGLTQFKTRTGISVEASYTFELVSTNAGWEAYCSGERDQFLIRVNKDRPDNLRQENLAALVRHELLGHANYHTLNLKSIVAGDLPLSAGLILLPCSDLLVDEGCAEVARVLFCDSPLGHLNGAMMDYNKLCTAQAIYTQWTHSKQRAIEQYMDLVPYEELSRLKNALTAVSDDLFWRYYRWSYPAAVAFFREASDTLGDTKFNLLLRDCYTAPRDVSDLAFLAHSHGMSVDQINKSLRPSSGFPGHIDEPECRRPMFIADAAQAIKSTRDPA